MHAPTQKWAIREALIDNNRNNIFDWTPCTNYFSLCIAFSDVPLLLVLCPHNGVILKTLLHFCGVSRASILQSKPPYNYKGMSGFTL